MDRSLSDNVLSQVVVTYSPLRQVMKLYLNGGLASSGIARLPLSGIIDTNNWLGKSPFASNPFYNGSYNEFRIFRGLLPDADVAADYAAGPEAVGVDFVLHSIVSPGNLTLSWGPSASGWVLESAPDLGPSAVWTAVPMTPYFKTDAAA